MSYIPQPLPFLFSNEPIAMEIKYEKQFTTVNDVWHDADHLHDFYEIYVNLSGDVSFRVGNQIFPIKRGDVILTSPNELHRCLYHSDCIHEHFCIWFKDFSLSEELLFSRFSDQPLLVLSAEDKEQVIEHCFELYQFQHAENELQFRVAHHFFAILDLILTGKQVANASQNLPVRFTEILLYVSRHFQESSFNVAALGRATHISCSTLNRYFLNYFQTSPSLYIESCRFSEAKKLLRSGFSVQHTCFHSGFSDCSYFIKRFHKKFGLTPMQYRKKWESGLGD